MSLTATPDSATVLAAGLVIVRLRFEMPPTAMLVGSNALVMVGADTAVKLAEAVVLDPPLVVVTGPAVLVNEPAAVAVTFTDTAQLLPAVTEPPLRLIDVAPAVGVKVPPQVLLWPGVLATLMPLGKVSVTPTPVRDALPDGLVIVRVRVEVKAAPTAIVPGAKALVSVGA